MTVHKAVALLRFRLGESREKFSRRHGLSVSATYKYEHNRVPEPKLLVRFMKLAEIEGYTDLADVFRGALCRAIGLSPDRILCNVPSRSERKAFVEFAERHVLSL